MMEVYVGVVVVVGMAVVVVGAGLKMSWYR